MRKYIYIHGLNSSKESNKFKTLQKKFTDIKILEWDSTTDINKKINDIVDDLSNTDSILIIGDSTGGNFACQLRDKLNKLNIYSKLVLLNPLLRIESLFDDIITKDIIKYIKPIDQIKDALLILSNNDSVVDNSNLEFYFENTTKIIRVDDSHRLSTFEKYIDMIEKYSKNITL